MPTVLTTNPPGSEANRTAPTFANLSELLGGIPAERIRYLPVPGSATEQDVIDADAHEDRFCELIDGTLVEKTMGFEEGYVGTILTTLLLNFVLERKLGIVLGEGGMIKLFPGQVRIPDVAFYSLQKLPGGKIPSEPIPFLTPDLAIEVLSKGNTAREMQRKVREYFEAGARLVWLVDPKNRQTQVFMCADQSAMRSEHDPLDGGSVLPGFGTTLRQVFEMMVG